MEATTLSAGATPRRLTILYDERCALCRRARDWLLTQPCLVEVELLAAGSPAAARRYGSIPWRGVELVAVDEAGNVWAGPAAYIACMWATVRYRAWAYRLSRPSLAPFARRIFGWISANRTRWPGGVDEDCSWCNEADRAPDPVGRCRNGHALSHAARFCTVCGAPRPTEAHT